MASGRGMAGQSIRSTPSAYATSICSAAFTSRLFGASAGRISTVASVRSAAMNRMSPAGMSRTAETGGGGGELLHRFLPSVRRVRCF